MSWSRSTSGRSARWTSPASSWPANLAAAFGDPFPTPTRVYHASPTPEQLAAAPLAAIRACGVGYRDRFIKGVAEAVAGGLDVEALKSFPREEAHPRELMYLPGVGPYTADLGLIIGARRRDALFLDVFIREVLRRFYFDGAPVPDDRLLRLAEERWGPVPFRLRSGALSDPDP